MNGSREKEYLGGLVYVKRHPNGDLVTRPQVLESKYRDSLSSEIVADSLLRFHARNAKAAKAKYLDLLPYHRELLGKGRVRVRVGGKERML